METICEKLKQDIRHYIEEGNIEKAMETVDDLGKLALHIGMQYMENVLDSKQNKDDRT